jgi:hypothetical protein
LPHGAWAGLASPAMRGEEDRQLTFDVRDGATGSGGVEAEGRVSDEVGDGDSAASWEVAA